MAQGGALISWSADISGPHFLTFGWLQDDYSTTVIVRFNDEHRYPKGQEGGLLHFF